MANQNGGGGYKPPSTMELKALLAQRKQDLQKAAPALTPMGMSAQPSNWDEMKQREDRIHHIQERLHHHSKKFRNDFDMSR